MKQSLHEDLNEGGHQMTRKLKEEKEAFVKKFQKHQIRQSAEDFAKATQGKSNFNVVSVERRKDDVAHLESEVRKDKSHKRQKHR